MLILTRKVGESIMITDDIEVFVMRVNRGQVKIGCDAPKDVKILRSELVRKELPLDAI